MLKNVIVIVCIKCIQAQFQWNKIGLCIVDLNLSNQSLLDMNVKWQTIELTVNMSFPKLICELIISY